MSRGHRYLALIAIASGLFAASLWAQAPATGAVFTIAQAEAGKAAYQAHCASCHAADLGGQNEFPQLAGDDFLAAWKARSTQELFDYLTAAMPPEGPSLTPEEYLGITALILHENGASAGAKALTATTMVPIGSVASGKRPGFLAVGHPAQPASRRRGARW